jgi:uroporphyrinogen-III decarboxylase
MALAVIERCIAVQIDAGASAIVVCEPAANRVYLSPKQLARGSDVFERMVMAPLRRVKAQLDAAGVDLMLHDCGELMDEMVGWLASLDPAMMSLGSSRKLWEDAARVPRTTVLYGNLPTKRFYAPDLTIEQVEAMTCDLLARMRAVDHPFILGSECDVLSVEGAREAIVEKVAAFCTCGCDG